MKLTGCTLIVVFAFLFVGQTINRLPRDILLLREHYAARNWDEFYVQLAEAGFFWLVSILIVLFMIIPFLQVETGVGTRLSWILHFLGR